MLCVSDVDTAAYLGTCRTRETASGFSQSSSVGLPVCICAQQRQQRSRSQAVAGPGSLTQQVRLIRGHAAAAFVPTPCL